MTGDDVRQRCLLPRSAGEVTDRLIDVAVIGTVDLADCTIAGPLVFEDVTFRDVVDLTSIDTGGIRFTRCRFDAGLLANSANIDGDLTFDHCQISGSVANPFSSSRPAAVWLTEAKINGWLSAPGSKITGGPGFAGDQPARSLQADRIKVGGNVRLTHGFTAVGEVKMTGADIGGSLTLSGATLSDRFVALYLAEASIGANLSIMPSRRAGPSTIVGGLVMPNCSVGGQVLIHATDLIAPDHGLHDDARYRFRGGRSGVAINAARARLQGDVILYGGCRVEGVIRLGTSVIGGRLDLDDTIIEEPATGWAGLKWTLDAANTTIASDVRFNGAAGSIRLESSVVEGSVHLEGLSLQSTGRKALQARNIRVGGDVWLDGATIVDGDTDFRLAQVAGDWRAPTVHLSNAEPAALTLTSARIGGSVFMNRGFTSEGQVRLNRLSAEGRLVLEDATFQARPAGGVAIVARSCTIGAGIFLDWTVSGEVRFQSTSTTILADDPTRWGDRYAIAGLSYERLGRDRQDAGHDLESRLAWLANQSEPDAGCYEQLADYYRRQGRSIDAEHVLIARNRYLRVERRRIGGWRNRLKNGADRLSDLSIGYGFRSSRAAIALIALVAATALALGSPAGEQVMVTTDENNVVYSPWGPRDQGGASDLRSACGDGNVRCFNPVFYSIDTVVPLIDLHQRGTWYPNRDAPRGQLFEWGLNLAVLAGWALSSALVLGLSHVLSPSHAR